MEKTWAKHEKQCTLYCMVLTFPWLSTVLQAITNFERLLLIYDHGSAWTHSHKWFITFPLKVISLPLKVHVFVSRFRHPTFSYSNSSAFSLVCLQHFSQNVLGHKRFDKKSEMKRYIRTCTDNDNATENVRLPEQTSLKDDRTLTTGRYTHGENTRQSWSFGACGVMNALLDEAI